jgi:emfourin
MKIEFLRTGGQGPISRRSASVDVSALPDAEAREAEQLVASARFFELPEKLESATMPDSFTYRITVEQDGNSHTVEAGQSALSGALHELVNWLMSRARPG